LLLAQKLWAEPLAFSQAWNFGPRDEDAKPVEWIVKNLAGNWKKNATWVVDAAEHPHEAGYLKLDISKASSLLGWTPGWPLGLALEKIVTWSSEMHGGADPADICLKQIKEYVAT
jgi:CDP-glucose 4,6-dehydratase